MENNKKTIKEEILKLFRGKEESMELCYFIDRCLLFTALGEVRDITPQQCNNLILANPDIKIWTAMPQNPKYIDGSNIAEFVTNGSEPELPEIFKGKNVTHISVPCDKTADEIMMVYFNLRNKEEIESKTVRTNIV